MQTGKIKDAQASTVGAGRGANDQIVAVGRYTATAHKPDGSVAWVRHVDNLITTAGLNKILNETLAGSGYTAAWYAGLVDDGPTFDAADTLASHAGWTEITAYTGDRKAITFGAAAAGVKASSSIPTFAISGSATLAGLFVCDAATGTSGVLLSEGLFTDGDAPVASGYVVTVTYQLTLASG